MTEYLKIAIQKNGRLSEKTKELIKSCGIDTGANNGCLKSRAVNFPLEFLYLRDDDIPGYVADGVADIGILGLNEVEEKKEEVIVLEKLGFSKCRLSIAVPNTSEFNSISDLNGRKIATSYPNILSTFLKGRNIQAIIHEISGSVEIAPTIGLSDAICDIVSTGSTLLSNGLKELEQIYFSEAVLISSPNLPNNKLDILNKLLIRIKAVRRSRNHKYILLNAPNNALEEIEKILPGMKSPTIMPLSIAGWSSVHSVVCEDDFWDINERLQVAGAEGILVVNIEKMIN